MTIPTAEITENERVGREIKAWLARHSLKQTDLADVIGVAQKNVSRRLRGEIPFRIDELLAITQALDITLGQLLGNDLVNEKNPHLVSGEGSRGQTSGHFVAGDGFEPSTSGLRTPFLPGCALRVKPRPSVLQRVSSLSNRHFAGRGGQSLGRTVPGWRICSLGGGHRTLSGALRHG